METGITSGTLAQGSPEDYLKRRAVLEKKWDEATVEEKLEKMREELIQLAYMQNSINNISMDVQKLKEHDHKDGKVIISLNANSINGLGIGGQMRRNNLA